MCMNTHTYKCICVQMELNCDNIFTVIYGNLYIKTELKLWIWNSLLCWVEQTEKGVTVCRVMYTADHLINFIKLDSSRSRLCVSGVVYSMFHCFLPLNYYLISFLCHVMFLSKTCFIFTDWVTLCITLIMCWHFCRSQTFACKNKVFYRFSLL